VSVYISIYIYTYIHDHSPILRAVLYTCVHEYTCMYIYIYILLCMFTISPIFRAMCIHCIPPKNGANATKSFFFKGLLVVLWYQRSLSNEHTSITGTDKLVYSIEMVNGFQKVLPESVDLESEVDLVHNDSLWPASSEGVYYMFGGPQPKRVQLTHSWAVYIHTLICIRPFADSSSCTLSLCMHIHMYICM